MKSIIQRSATMVSVFRSLDTSFLLIQVNHTFSAVEMKFSSIFVLLFSGGDCHDHDRLSAEDSRPQCFRYSSAMQKPHLNIFDSEFSLQIKNETINKVWDLSVERNFAAKLQRRPPTHQYEKMANFHPPFCVPPSSKGHRVEKGVRNDYRKRRCL